MKRQLVLLIFVYEPIARALYGWLKYMDNSRKGKPLSPKWQERWMIYVYSLQGYGRPNIRRAPDGILLELDWEGITPEWDRV
jgi:hypothetical protein